MRMLCMCVSMLCIVTCTCTSHAHACTCTSCTCMHMHAHACTCMHMHMLYMHMHMHICMYVCVRLAPWKHVGGQRRLRCACPLPRGVAKVWPGRALCVHRVSSRELAHLERLSRAVVHSQRELRFVRLDGDDLVQEDVVRPGKVVMGRCGGGAVVRWWCGSAVVRWRGGEVAR